MSGQRITDQTIAGRPTAKFRAQRALMRFGEKVPKGGERRIYDARPWYHDFSRFGVMTNFGQHASLGEKAINAVRSIVGKPPVGQHANQAVKDEQIIPYLQRAFALHVAEYGPVGELLDLFSADGYYSFLGVRELGAQHATAVDLRSYYLEQGRLVAGVLNEERVSFVQGDVYELDDSPADVCLCAGGLYHVTDPELLLKNLRAKANVLVTQSIVTTHTDDPTFFVSPAPGLPHGCRFTHGYFEAMLKRTGWQIVEGRFDMVGGPINAYSKGSSTFICKR